MATAEWFSCLRMRTIAIAHTNPERIPNQSPILRGTGKLRPNPKITNIPIIAGKNPCVKIDGSNPSFKLVDGPNGKEFAVDRASMKEIDISGITVDRINERFPPGHGMRAAITLLLDIFNEALPKITSELKTLGLWDDSTKFFNTEYVEGTTNVTEYDENFIAIHGINQFYESIFLLF